MKLDGDSAPLAATPDSLVNTGPLVAGTRVRCELTDRRVIVHGVMGGTPSRKATVSPTWTTGLPPVTLDGQAGMTAPLPYDSNNGWTPIPGQRVYVVSTDFGYIIGGPLNESGPVYLNQIPIQHSSAWGTHATYYPPTATKTADGIVMLQGALVRVDGAATNADEVIGTLPVGMWPDYDLVFICDYYTGAPTALTIKADGTICARESLTSGQTGYLALGNIAFPAAGVASWTKASTPGFAYVNGFTSLLSDSHGNYGEPRFWVDTYGFVWGQGILQGGNTHADDTTMLAVPDKFRATNMNHVITTSNNRMGLLGTEPTPYATNPNIGIKWKTSTQSSGWISLCGLTGYEQLGTTHNWQAYPGAGTWTAYNNGFTPPAFLVLPNKMVRVRGLFASSSGNSQIGVLPVGARPVPDAVHTAGNPSARAATNNSAHIEANPNGTDWETALFNSNAWFSMDIRQFALGG